MASFSLKSVVNHHFGNAQVPSSATGPRRESGGSVVPQEQRSYREFPDQFLNIFVICLCDSCFGDEVFMSHLGSG